MLSELHITTPKKLRLDLQGKYVGYTPKKGTPLTQSPLTYSEVFSPSSYPTFPIKTDYQYIPPVPSDFMEIPSTSEPETVEEIAPEVTDNEEVHITQQTVDIKEGKVYTVDIDTGEILEEADLYIEETDEGEELYINGDTGEIVGHNVSSKYGIPNMDNFAMEYLYDIINQFPDKYQQAMQKALDKMISEKGLQATSEAFLQTAENRPNMLDKLSDARERYNEAVALLEEMADILDVPITLKRDIKDYVYRESMTDIETYGT